MNTVKISRTVFFDYQCDCFCFDWQQDNGSFVLHAGKKSVIER